MTDPSYAVGAAMPPVPAGTIGMWLDAAADGVPDADALVVSDKRWKWSGLRARIKGVTIRLQPYDGLVDAFPMMVTGTIQKFAMRDAGTAA